MSESLFFQQQRAALLELLDFVGQSVSYNGVTYKGCVSSIATETELKDTGLLDNLEVTIVFARTHFTATTAPRVGQTLTTDGTEFRITKIDRDPVSYRLTCTAATI